MRVVGTAGHVDHGKSSLVLALTGTDPDRFAEEKERGLTIDLGFAYTGLPSGAEIGFVDVPGHVRFLKNMLAGAGAVRAAVLVVAATEGWMPQSEEHLRILELLGVGAGLTVVTKADLVDEDTLELAMLEVADHLAGTFLADAPVVACDSLSGRGLADVRSALDGLLASLPPEPDEDRPRLWIDRVFSARGAGTVVTGTLTGGALRLDDELTVVPGRVRGRVRGIQSGYREEGVALPGTRVALNLSGVERADATRGHALVRTGAWTETDVVDGSVSLLGGAALRPRAGLKVYAGSGEHDAVVRSLGGGFARVFLGTRLPLAPGDRIVLRDPGPDITLGGVVVLDVAPTTRVRDAAAVLALAEPQRLLAGRPWLAVAEVPALTGRSREAAGTLVDGLVAAGTAWRVGPWLVASVEAERVLREAIGLVDAHGREHRFEEGIDLPAAAGRLDVDAERLRALVETRGGDQVVVERGRLRRPGVVADPMDDPEARRLVEALDADPFSPPSPADVGVERPVVRALVRRGVVVELDGIAFTASAVAEAIRRIGEALGEAGAVTVGDVRDLLGSSRKYVLALLNHLDATGVTRRKGDQRVAGPRA
jgi:selenocysteine-specific elongation factor